MTEQQDASDGVDPKAPRSLALWLASGADFQRRAAALSLASSLVWPLQAALVAFAIAGLLVDDSIPPLKVALAFVLFGVLRAGLSYLSETQSDAASDTIIRELRSYVLATEARRAASSPFGGAGSISALAGEKLDLLAPYITRYAPAKARVMVVPLVILALALWNSWAVAVIFAISGPLIPVFMALVGMAAKEASQRQMDEIGNLNDMLVERLSALVDIRLLGAGDTVMAGFAAKAADLRQRTMVVLRVAFLSSTVLELFAAIGVAMVAVYVGFSLLGVLEFGAWGAPLSPEAGVFLLLLAPEFYQPMRDLSAAWHDKAAAEAVGADLANWDAGKTPDLMGAGGPAEPLFGPARIALNGCVLEGGIVLPDMRIEAGESVALMGPSGAGKTSALRLMAGLSAPESGQVSVADRTLDASNADAWRARIGWMPQSPHFLNASLRQNLTLGRGGDPDRALQQAAVADVVAALPAGLNTKLGETGGGLSGGEARRVTLARAIHGMPDIILADEPTADLDAQTAQAVADGLLAQARRGATLIIATHDKDLAARMDRVIMIGEPT
ncbi:thiol reductant ABC exporter subunit CydD [Litoreibacter janthinus]|uniref:ATP-binding cassette, subfamily C, CydD n=1 Tax=Litoreibacter janthinus TaxID=670154 RepID=A0A1I6HH44_9RHOB|nr:thiol reductant ABC exporter subunit CydD [Litoreibacter janthinus]SFR53759.1 ATP-binding cassette, subfamily C, CydD [Litoreibacter janthinus]